MVVDVDASPSPRHWPLESLVFIRRNASTRPESAEAKPTRGSTIAGECEVTKEHSTVHLHEAIKALNANEIGQATHDIVTARQICAALPGA